MKIAMEGIRAPAPPRAAERKAASGDGEAFVAGLRDAMQGMEKVADDADSATEGLVSGHVGIHEAMVAMEKADLVLKLGTAVRNKLLDAYRQLSQAQGG